MNPTNPAANIDPALSAQFVANMCIIAEREPQESFNLDEVVSLLHANGFAITPGVVAEFIRKKYIGEPADDEWTIPEVHRLVIELHRRRRWQPMPNIHHDSFKSVARKNVEMRNLAGVDSPICDLEQHSLEDLLIQMAEMDYRPFREAIYEVIRLKLSAIGFIEE